MKKALLVLVVVLCALAATAQSQYKYKYIGASFQPQYAVRLIKTGANTIDTLSSTEKNRAGYSVGIQYHKQMGKNLLLQIGVQYTNVGYTRVINNLTYKTVLHPSLPPLDQTIATVPEPTAEMNYVFDYIDIPVMLNRRVYLFPIPNKRWEFYVSYGASVNFLIQDRIAVRLKGFTINNDRSFNLNKTYLTTNIFNITGHFGFRANYQYSNKLGFITQPLLNIAGLNSSRGQRANHFASVGLQVGFYYNLDLKGEEEVIE
jgi:hypothetical protein